MERMPERQLKSPESSMDVNKTENISIIPET